MTQDNTGHQSVLRWHMADNVPFQKSFEGCIEKYYTNEERGTLYACVGLLVSVARRRRSLRAGPGRPAATATTSSPPRTAGGFKVLGRAARATSRRRRWPASARASGSDDDQLWWTGAKPGDKLDLVVPVKQSRHVRRERRPDQGPATTASCSSPSTARRSASRSTSTTPRSSRPSPIPLGAHDLTEGEHKLTVEIVGANDKAIKSYMFGLDYVIFKPAR